MLAWQCVWWICGNLPKGCCCLRAAGMAATSMHAPPLALAALNCCLRCAPCCVLRPGLLLHPTSQQWRRLMMHPPVRCRAPVLPAPQVSGGADTFMIITRAVASFIKLYLLLLFVRVLLSWFPTFQWWEQQPFAALRQVGISQGERAMNGSKGAANVAWMTLCSGGQQQGAAGWPPELGLSRQPVNVRSAAQRAVPPCLSPPLSAGVDPHPFSFCLLCPTGHRPVPEAVLGPGAAAAGLHRPDPPLWLLHPSVPGR